MSKILHDQIDELFRAREAELIELHRLLVRIPTVNKGDGSPAGEDRLAEAAADYLRSAAGIKARVVAGAPGRANLLAETNYPVAAEVEQDLDAADTESATPAAPARILLWMSHSDVVPVGDESAWIHPPFSAELEAGRIWGRGANDCKMLVAAQLYAQAGLARLGLPRRGKLRTAVGADEEVGGRWGFGYLLEQHPDFLKADLALCEGGGSSLGSFEEGLPVISVGSGEKGRYDVIFRARAEGGHASTPWGKRNPLVLLTEIVAHLTAWRPEPQPASPVFRRLARWAGMSEPLTGATVDEAIARIEPLAPSLASSLRGQSRMTITPTVLHCGDKANAIPTEATLICDARLLPGQTTQDIERVVQGIAAGIEGVTFEIAETSEPSVSEFNDELAGRFQRATERSLGAPARIAATWCVGATDAHYVRAVGTPVYGYQLVTPAADPKRLSIHCINESIEAAMLLPCALSLAHFAVEYLEEG